MNTTRTLTTITLVALLGGCATTPPADSFIRFSAPPETGCEDVAFDRQNLAFRCDERTYDLLQTPVRSRKIYDFVTRERFTRRHFVNSASGKRYVYRTEQMEGEGFPTRVVLETRQGFMLLKLDRLGQVVSTAMKSRL
jgi:hypothetical protein